MSVGWIVLSRQKKNLLSPRDITGKSPLHQSQVNRYHRLTSSASLTPFFPVLDLFVGFAVAAVAVVAVIIIVVAAAVA